MNDSQSPAPRPSPAAFAAPAGRTNVNGNKQWDSVHRCPECGHMLNLRDIDLMGVTTGIVDCPNCERTGSIEIQIVEREKPAE